MISVSKVAAHQFLKYCIVGGSGVAVNFGIAVVLVDVMDFHYKVGLLMGIGTSVVTNFLLNKFWTFRGK